MLSSRMFTTAFRFFAGLAVFSLIAAFAVGFTSQNQSLMNRVLGPLTLGWKGGVGNHFAYTFFVGLFAAAAALAGLLIAFRDADPDAEAQIVRMETVPLTRAPIGVNYLPALGALAFVLMLIGLATESSGLTFAAVAVMVVVAFTWTVRTWAERATGDDHTNAELYHRFIDPFRVPVISILLIGLVAIGLSRVLLSVSKIGSVWVFGLVALLFFLVAVLLALKPSSAKWVTTAVVVLGAIAIVAAGIAGAVIGERDIEHHDSGDHATEGAVGLDPGAPIVIQGGTSA
jgi:MFS family permease